MTKIKIPGLIDPHVHMREPGAEHKEDWYSGTCAALAGGITMLLAMPNTNPPLTEPESFAHCTDLAKQKAVCNYGIFYGAGPDNSKRIAAGAENSAGLKMYLDSTFGELRLDQMTLWMEHFEDWPKDCPIAVHAESRTMAAAILIAELYDRAIHICHVSRAEEIILIRAAKEKGLKVTCEVAPHHLFMSQADVERLGFGRSEVRPLLASQNDQDVLWENLEVIDCFATDHAPHTLAEKDSPKPPPGYPGLESILPLLLTAVHQDRLSLEDIIKRMVTNPRKIFNLPEQADTYVEIDLDIEWKFQAKNTHTKAGWSPFENWDLRGKVSKVVLRGDIVYQENKILAQAGTGRNIRIGSNLEEQKK